MRPSKLRLPDSTAVVTSFSRSMASTTASGSGPEPPLQVVQPKPATWKPSASSAGCSPAFSSTAAVTWLPGTSDVLTHGLVRRPRATAFCATSPAAIMLAALAVLVQEVMAAITTAPSNRA